MVGPRGRLRRATRPADLGLPEPYGSTRPEPQAAADRSSEPEPRSGSALRNDALERLFLSFRVESARFRDEVIAAADGLFALPPDAQARANLRIVRSIFGKWSIDLLTVLVTLRTARFSDLRRTLRGISSDVLSTKLRALESVGLIERHVLGLRPPAVEYCLTEDGLTLMRLGEPVLLFLRLRQPSGARP